MLSVQNQPGRATLFSTTDTRYSELTVHAVLTHCPVFSRSQPRSAFQVAQADRACNSLLQRSTQRGGLIVQAITDRACTQSFAPALRRSQVLYIPKRNKLTFLSVTDTYVHTHVHTHIARSRLPRANALGNYTREYSYVLYMMTVQFYNYLAAVEVQPQSVATPTHKFTRALYSFDRLHHFRDKQ